MPVINYCSNIWGFLSLRIRELFEELHLQFIKEIFDVHCETLNDACRAELGGIPMKDGTLIFCDK